MTRNRAMDGTFAAKTPPPTHYHFGTWNTPRPGTDCDDCRDDPAVALAPCPDCGTPKLHSLDSPCPVRTVPR